MIQAHSLCVSTPDQTAGWLKFSVREDRYGFHYAPAWLANRLAYRLAPAIPLVERPAAAAAVHRFLENLLPEGRALDIAASHNQISKSNIFALIHRLGEEAFGAFRCRADDAAPDEAAWIEEDPPPPARRPMPSEELSQRIRERDAVPFPVWDGKLRLSLAADPDKPPPFGLSPAPMYDLVSVNVYGERMDSELAMAYGDAVRIGQVTPYAMADFAHRTGTSPAQLAREISGMARGALRLAPALAVSDGYVGAGRGFVRQISDFVRAQAKWLIALVHEVPRVPGSLV